MRRPAVHSDNYIVKGHWLPLLNFIRNIATVSLSGFDDMDHSETYSGDRHYFAGCSLHIMSESSYLLEYQSEMRVKSLFSISERDFQ